MTFDFALWSEGKVPVTLVCEEAHRYVPATPQLGFEPCKRAIAKIAKEGRKYGVVAVHRHAAPGRDRSDHPVPVQHGVRAAHVQRPRPGDRHARRSPTRARACWSFCPALGQREAIAFGDGVALPVRIKFDELPAHCLPRSSTARFTENWQHRSATKASSSTSSRSGARRISAPAGDLSQMALIAEGLVPDVMAPLPPEAPRQADGRRAEPRSNPAARARPAASAGLRGASGSTGIGAADDAAQSA